MSRVVDIQGDRPVFPVNACVHCLQPAARTVEIVKVKGYTVRRVRVPFCDQCIATRESKSRRQVLFERVAVTNSLLLALAVGVRTYSFAASLPVLDPGTAWVWSALLGVLVAGIVFGAMDLLVQPWALRFRSPEAKVTWRAVTIKDFDWETTRLEFENEEYAERFAQVNSAAKE